MMDQTPENPENEGSPEPVTPEEDTPDVQDRPVIADQPEPPSAEEEKPEEEPKADETPKKRLRSRRLSRRSGVRSRRKRPVAKAFSKPEKDNAKSAPAEKELNGDKGTEPKKDKDDDEKAPPKEEKDDAPRKPGRRTAAAMQAKATVSWYGQMEPGTQAKLLVVGITGLLLLIFLLSFLFSGGGSSKPNIRYKGLGAELEKAKTLFSQGKNMIRKAESKSSSRERNSGYKDAEEILWKARGIYGDLIDEHGDEEGYEYLQTGIAEIQKYIFHCQKNRTLD